MSSLVGQNRRSPADLVIGGLIALLVILALWFALSQRQQVLRTSPVGFDGLKTWLVSEGVAAQRFTGGWFINEEQVGLLVVPLFDTDPTSIRRSPTTKEELIFQQDEYDLSWTDIMAKADRVPTLVVLPKWRTGLRLTGLGHPVLLVERRRVENALRQITGDSGASVRYARQPFTTYSYVDDPALNAQLYAAQHFNSDGCAPIVGAPRQMILARCNVSDRT